MKRYAGFALIVIVLAHISGFAAAQTAKPENAPRLSPNVTEEMRTPRLLDRQPQRKS